MKYLITGILLVFLLAVGVYSITVTPSSPQTWTVASIEFNHTFVDTILGQVINDIAYLEINHTGTNTNYTMNQDKNNTINNTGLVGYWHMDLANGTVIADDSTEGNNGTYTGETFNDGVNYGATWTSSGKYGGAYSFDGNDDIDIGDVDILNDQITVMLWFKNTSAVDNYWQLSKKGTGSTDNYGIYLDTTTHTISMVVQNTSDRIGTVGTVVASGEWQHATLSCNSTHSNLYVDGVLDKSTVFSGNFLDINANWTFGDDNTESALYGLEGLIDEVRIWNRSLSLSEIQEEKDSTYPENGTGLVASYSFKSDNPYDSHNWVQGEYGSGLHFKGDQDFINITDDASLRFDSNTIDYSICSWIKTNNNNSVAIIVGKRDADNDGYTFITNTNGRIQCSLNQTDALSANNVITVNNWHHICCVVDRDVNITLYVDGSQTGTPVSADTGTMATTNDLVIGAVSYATSTFEFNGTIDEVRVWNRSLSASEISTLYLLTSPYNYTYTYTITDPPAGSHPYTFFADYTDGTETNSTTETYVVNRGASGLSLSSSPSFTTTPGTSVTVTCLGDDLRTLEKDSVSVANPFTASYTTGIYNFTCSMTDSQNYTPTTTQNDLTISSTLFGCTNTETYTFNKTITSPGGILLNLNFTDLVGSNYVRSDLRDVWVNTSVVTNAWTNFTSGSYLLVNVTGVSTFIVKFGNYIGNQSYTNDTQSDNTTAISNYNQENGYYFLTFLNEETSNQLLPSSANNTVTLFCPNGESTFSLNNSQILVSSLETLDEIKTKVEYSSTNFYYRNILIDDPVEFRNIYLVDALETSVIQIILTMEDLSGDFIGAELKIKKNLESELVTITELNFDTENKVILYLIDGDKYTVTVESATESRTIGFLYADSADLTKTITIFKIITSEIEIGNVSLSMTLLSDTVRFYWNDPTNQTNLVEFWVYNHSNNVELFSASSTNRSTVEFTYVVPDISWTYRGKYLVHHGIFGNNTFGLERILSNITITEPNVTFPIIGLIEGLGGTDTDVKNTWFFLLFIVPIPLMFTSRFRAFGAILMVGIVALMSAWGYYPIEATVIIPFMLLIAVFELASFTRRERR